MVEELCERAIDKCVQDFWDQGLVGFDIKSHMRVIFRQFKQRLQNQGRRRPWVQMTRAMYRYTCDQLAELARELLNIFKIEDNTWKLIATVFANLLVAELSVRTGDQIQLDIIAQAVRNAMRIDSKKIIDMAKEQRTSYPPEPFEVFN